MDSKQEEFNGDTLSKLIDIGIALSATVRTNDLLKLITTEARRLTNSDAGSLYLKEEGGLRFAISQSDTLESKESGTITHAVFKESVIPISEKSIAGYVALKKEVQVLDDAYNMPEDRPYEFNKSFDEQNCYRTHSMLAVPMLDVEGRVVGVLQLINHLDKKGNPAPFPESVIPLVKALASQAAVAVKNAQLTEQLKKIHYDTILRLSNAADTRDNETGNHIRRVSLFCRLIAEKCGLSEDEQEMIMVASPMHDIGKVGIRDEILLKPGIFTEEEREIMKTHTDMGGDIMADSDSPLLQMCEEIARTHHERWDGKGYPKGTSGEEIPIAGRICAVADVFDALSCKRVYKDAFPMEKVLRIIRNDSATAFDKDVVDAFFKALPEILRVSKELQG